MCITTCDCFAIVSMLPEVDYVLITSLFCYSKQELFGDASCLLCQIRIRMNITITDVRLFTDIESLWLQELRRNLYGTN